MSGRLAGRVAIVTGSGSGIGQGIAQRFAEEGARLVVNDISDERARPTVEAIVASGGSAVACAGDVSTRECADALLATAIDSFGRVDALVNNAGVLTFAQLLDIGEDDWDRVMRINTRSVFLCTQVIARHWVATAARGKVVNIASTQAEMGSSAGLAHYASSKGAVRMFTKIAAVELAPHGINVNAIGPGTIPTGIGSGDVVTAAEVDAAAASRPTTAVPIGRMGSARDIANLALYMCSDESDYMTGQLVLIDGGRNLSVGDARSMAQSSPGS